MAKILKFDGFSVFMVSFSFLKHLDSYFDKMGFLKKPNIRIIYEYCLDVARLQKSKLLSHG